MKPILRYLPFFLAISTAVIFSGCASKPHELQAAHVSTAGYKGYECKELHAELQNNINRVNDLLGILDEKASGDEAQMAIGMILFWPALFALEGGDGVEAAEYSRLRGEINAIEQVAIIKECEAVIELAKEYRESEKEARLQRERIKAEQQSSGFGH